MRTGIAIIPRDEDIDSLVKLQEDIQKVEPLRPILGRKENLPHITLVQGSAEGPLCSCRELRSIAEIVQERQDEIVVGPVSHEPRGWYFLRVELTRWIKRAHDEAFRAVRHSMRPPPDDLSREIRHYTPPQKRNYLRYGYRYLGDEFSPHVTLGRTDNLNRSSHEGAIVKVVDRRSLRRVVPARVTLFEVGEHGSHARPIEEVALEK